ncbi:hypothetical protein BDC45DRAFT_512768 [Circinella umbellata]|nr:hypothetical protein BDC45DRAFT_512768 [Circinella umbellata]
MSSTDLVLKLVKSVHQPVHIKEYAGKTVAVDGHALFQHVSKSSDSLLLKNNKDDNQKEKDDTNDESTKQLTLLDILRSNNVIPLVVVEGKPLPCDQKKKTKGDNDTDNDTNNENNNDDKNNSHHDVLLEQLKKEKIEYIQAPYESKAQISYLIENKRVEAVILLDDKEDRMAFGYKEMIFGIDNKGSATRLRYSDLTSAKEIELRDWSLKSIQELCLMIMMCNDCANVQLERAYSLFVKHKKNIRSALQELIKEYNDTHDNKKKDLKQIYSRLSSRWSQKVYDEKLNRNVSWHKDSALEAKSTNKTSTTPTGKKKTIKTIRLHQDNKENIPPWMSRTIQGTTIQPIHRDNPEPPQQAPRVVEQEKTIKVAPFTKKDNQKVDLKESLSSSLKSKTTTSTTLKEKTLTMNKPPKSTQITTPSTKSTRTWSIDKKRKSLEGVDDENSPMSENNTNTSNKKRGSQSLPLRKRVGLSDGSNRRTLF